MPSDAGSTNLFPDPAYRPVEYELATDLTPAPPVLPIKYDSRPFPDRSDSSHYKQRLMLATTSADALRMFRG
ncbi:uncharacterized protein SCHCODRAFT_02520526 [Schizophyllum commune H4-8]|nr:uncharacterized protein SCHCODRAFT_02520526 [Schizophyllum commune H4-8]KAI5885411.1 hypothetical protein SCHCODRAFT_02520526 [Schizophyllum commune H4-8]